MSELTERIDLLLSQINKKRVDLSRGSGLGESTIRAWYSGSKPSAEALLKVSQYFGVSLEYLLTGNDPAVVDPFDLMDEEEVDLLQQYRKLSSKEKYITKRLISAFLDSVTN